MFGNRTGSRADDEGLGITAVISGVMKLHTTVHLRCVRRVTANM